ncbi:MAG: PIN domain-containing protein [Actinobacteria bacterium]|nr:PIN domain-containing protein [Actinomycetota bacterium]
MNRLLLDTNVLIDFERADEELDSILLDEDDAAISTITVAELDVGVHSASPENRKRRRTSVDAIIDNVLVIPYDIEVARRHAMLIAHTRRIGRPRGPHDLIVAATAAASRRILVSDDRSAFTDLPGVVLLDA